MNQASFKVGDPVRIAAGVYTNAEGVIEDIQPECDAVRVHGKNGTVYGFIEDLMPVQPPMPMLPAAAKKNPLIKK